MKPFAVQNLGKYERQAWQVAEFPANGKNHLEEQCQREAAYRTFILDLETDQRVCVAPRHKKRTHGSRTDHRLRTGVPFKYHSSQQEAIETLIFVWEFEKIRTRKGLLERYAQNLRDLRLPPYDDFARYCVKMATGSGKTKVMALAVAWQFFNAMRESEEIAKEYAKTFLVIAPNVIVFERLKTDFAGGAIFRNDPISPEGTGNFLGLRLRDAR